MGVITAPASGSGMWPACTARVPKRRFRSSPDACVMAGTEGGLPSRASDLYVKGTKPQPDPGKCLGVDDEPRVPPGRGGLLRGGGCDCGGAGAATAGRE